MSEERVRCNHADRCGGCPWITLSYEEQQEKKYVRVRTALDRYHTLRALQLASLHPAEQMSGYRTRSKLVVGFVEKRVAIGLYAVGGTHDVVNTPECRVMPDAIREVVQLIRMLAQEPEHIFARPVRHRISQQMEPLLQAVDVRECVDEQGKSSLLVTLIIESESLRHPSELEAFRHAAQAIQTGCPLVRGVALSLREHQTPQMLGSDTTLLVGEAFVVDHIGDVAHIATFGAFVQAHRAQAHFVHQTLIRQLNLTPGDRVLDLFGGSGAIGLALCNAGADVTLVESFGPAAQLAQEAATKLPLGAGELTAKIGDVGRVLSRIHDSLELREFKPFEHVILNPPRRGLIADVRFSVAKLNPQRIGYVSCDPETLARDLAHFSILGYAPVSLQPLDMIPLTEEVETIAILVQQEPPPPRVAYVDEHIVIVEKSPHEPILSSGLHSLTSRTRRLGGCLNAEAVSFLNDECSGLVVYAKHAHEVAQWRDVFQQETSRSVFLAGTRGRVPAKGAVARELRDDGKIYAARTRFRWLGNMGGHSLARVIPEGKHNEQIYKHLAHIGHPVLGDLRHGHAPTNRFFQEKYALERPFLHCIRLEFVHPFARGPKGAATKLYVEAPLPGDLRLVIERCGGGQVIQFLEGKQALGHPVPSLITPSSSKASSSVPNIDGEEESGPLRRS